MMGMDVYGNKPKNKCGKYFGISARSWCPLATYACEVAPEITAKCKLWYSNDFDGLNGEDSILLADVLQKEIDNGGCHRRWIDSYSFSVELLQEFVYFLRSCGGFQIG
jgi:hypothetical protein